MQKPKGTVVRLSCPSGHRLTTAKRRARCRRGRWRPDAHPRCAAVTCVLPETDVVGGYFARQADGALLPSGGEVSHGQRVSLRCQEGYFVSGDETRKCSFGEWSGSAEEPKCVGNPCELVDIPGGGW